ncbi:hypothetical protein [Hwanghaeella sp.]|uniref:hypothetical protein n=1 Tax=Hwanghaeella sp. TaxID=2605943 RepID=UPI003CCC08E6
MERQAPSWALRALSFRSNTTIHTFITVKRNALRPAFDRHVIIEAVVFGDRVALLSDCCNSLPDP